MLVSARRGEYSPSFPSRSLNPPDMEPLLLRLPIQASGNLQQMGTVADLNRHRIQIHPATGHTRGRPSSGPDPGRSTPSARAIKVRSGAVHPPSTAPAIEKLPTDDLRRQNTAPETGSPANPPGFPATVCLLKSARPWKTISTSSGIWSVTSSRWIHGYSNRNPARPVMPWKSAHARSVRIQVGAGGRPLTDCGLHSSRSGQPSTDRPGAGLQINIEIQVSSLLHQSRTKGQHERIGKAGGGPGCLQLKRLQSDCFQISVRAERSDQGRMEVALFFDWRGFEFHFEGVVILGPRSRNRARYRLVTIEAERPRIHRKTIGLDLNRFRAETRWGRRRPVRIEPNPAIPVRTPPGSDQAGTMTVADKAASQGRALTLMDHGSEAGTLRIPVACHSPCSGPRVAINSGARHCTRSSRKSRSPKVTRPSRATISGRKRWRLRHQVVYRLQHLGH